MWCYRKNKAVMRDFVLPNKPIINGIWLPGSECLCVRKAVDQGLLKKAKSIILVEKNHKDFTEMLKSAPSLLAVKCVYSALENITLDRFIDYAYLDFLGGLSQSVSRWISNVLSPHLVKNAVIAITQIYATRGSKIIPEQDVFLKGPEGREIRFRYGTLDLHTQRLLILLHRIFSLWDFDIETDAVCKIPIYRDVQHKMMVFKLVNFREPKDFRFHSL